MKRESFVNLRNYFWLWFSTALVVICAAVYFIDNPLGGRDGGTVVGYGLGILSTIGIIYLMWYGVRKRSYYSRFTTLKEILSSHIWIGIALVFIVAFHSGFSFGYNVHTLTYILMLLTVASGIWGAVLFRTLPVEIRSQRGGATISQLASALFSLSANVKELTTSPKKQRSDNFLKMARDLDLTATISIWRSLFSTLPKMLTPQEISKYIDSLPEEEQEDGVALVALLNKKRETIKKIQQETRAQTLIRGWLFLHLPISIALCVALAIHIFSVFFFW